MWVNAESAGAMLPFVPWMITRTYWFGCCLALLTRPGEIQVCLGAVARAASRPCLGALAAKGTLRTSIAASAVIAPLPPLPQRALDRDSPPRLPVPHSALDRVSLRSPPFLTFRVSFPRPRAGRMPVQSATGLLPAAAKSGRNLGFPGAPLHPPP